MTHDTAEDPDPDARAASARPPRARGTAARSTAAQQLSILLIEGRALIRECLLIAIDQYARDMVIEAVPTPAFVKGPTDGEASWSAIVYSLGPFHVGNRAIRRQITGLRRSWPDVPLILIAESRDMPSVVEGMRSGARGYIPTCTPFGVALEAIRLVSYGGVFVPAESLRNGSGFRTP